MRKFFAWMVIAAVACLISACETPVTKSNSVRISNLPSHTLQLAYAYQAQLDLLEQAFFGGIIDPDFYLAEKYQLTQALQNQFDVYEGSLRGFHPAPNGNK